jgi:hypothetical protein
MGKALRPAPATRTRRTQATGPLPEEQWPTVGIFTIKTADGSRIPSHALGDQHADAIIHGRYPPDQARRDFADSQTRLARWRQRHEPTPLDLILRLTR